MTGQKNRFSTTEKLWNLDDKQLKTPKHDAMVLWLMSHWQEFISFDKTFTNRFREYPFSDASIKSEMPVYSSKTFLAGYIDLSIIGEYVRENFHPQYVIHNIEVKPYIDSFGAVLRQLNSYKSFFGDTRTRTVKYYIFTLDNRFDAHFESQGIEVLHPPADFDIEEVMKFYGLV